VIAYKNGKEWAAYEVKTTGEPAKLKLQPDRDTIRADGKDLSFGKIKLTAQADGLSKETVVINAAK
jgi:beta-galactosidase